MAETSPDCRWHSSLEAKVVHLQIIEEKKVVESIIIIITNIIGKALIEKKRIKSNTKIEPRINNKRVNKENTHSHSETYKQCGQQDEKRQKTHSHSYK